MRYTFHLPVNLGCFEFILFQRVLVRGWWVDLVALRWNGGRGRSGSLFGAPDWRRRRRLEHLARRRLEHLTRRRRRLQQVERSGGSGVGGRRPLWGERQPLLPEIRKQSEVLRRDSQTE